MATQISLHTLVSFVLKPRRTRAATRLSLLGEQGADMSGELTECGTKCGARAPVFGAVCFQNIQ